MLTEHIQQIKLSVLNEIKLLTVFFQFVKQTFLVGLFNIIYFMYFIYFLLFYNLKLFILK